jgi:exonuclease SbcC
MSIREEERHALEELNVSQQKREIGLETLRRVREFDTKIDGFDETLKTVQKQLDQLETNRNIHRKNINKFEKQLVKLLQNKTLESLAQTLDEQEKNTEKLLLTGQKFSDLAQKQTEILQQIQNWQYLRTAVIHLESMEIEKSDLLERFDILETTIQEAETKRRIFIQKIELAKQNIVTLEAEWLSLNRIFALEEHRQHLHDGQPCPLCGALEHPFLYNNIPKPEKTRLELDKAKCHLEELIQTLNKIEIEQKTASHELVQLRLQMNGNVEKSKQEQSQIDELLKRLGCNNMPALETIDTTITNAEQTVQKILNDITKIEEFRSETESLRQLLQESTTIRDKWNSEKNILQLLDTQHQQRTEEFETYSKQRQEQFEQRTIIFGNKNPDKEEQQYAESIRLAQQKLETTIKNRQNAERDYSSLQQHYEIVEKNIAETNQTITDLNVDWNQFLRQIGFGSEDEFKSSRLTPEVRQVLETEKQHLETERIQLETRRNENKTALTNEITEQQKDGQPNAKQISIEYKEIGDKIALLQQEIGAIDSQLLRYENDTIKLQEKKKEQEVQQNICNLWRVIDDLIGSADGKKYRTFAQGLTFRILLGHANRQLEKMTDRYRLIYYDLPNRPALELAVIDTYQAGVVRSTKNLSGGESFLVSLALALGLSSMSSHRVRVDSLFLDEGFGTLDEQTLDTALNVLEGLRQEGKQIGIISHIPAIRERIAVQIQVRPVKEQQSTATISVERLY